MKDRRHACGTCGCGCGHKGIVTGVSRRRFLAGAGAAAGLAWIPLSSEAAESPAPPLKLNPLRVRPVLTYDTPTRRPETSWRNWGGIQSEADATAEKAHIAKELSGLRERAGFPLEILPVEAVRTVDQAKAVAQAEYDVLILYAAGGGLAVLEALVRKDRHNLMFLRHDPGPVYLWYEIVHPRFLRKTVDEYGQPGIDVHDIVVDRPDELLWRLRALAGLKNTLGQKMIAVGGAGGWGAGGRQAPAIARDLWKFDIVDVPYADLKPRIASAMKDPARQKKAAEDAGRLLGSWRVSLGTDRGFVDRAMILTGVFRDLMKEAAADAFTINACMGTIMGMSKTTACLPLSLLNDEGYMAFCESDFVVIPSGVLLHRISGLPVFLNDPTFPHDGVVTLAHCTAPRRMDGRRLEPARILTHFESDYGAAPKVEFRVGQVSTNLVPDFACREWVGFEGTVVGNPFLDICRSQVDVRVKGDADALMERMKGFHWMFSYGNFLRETGYALRKTGVGFRNVSAPSTPA